MSRNAEEHATIPLIDTGDPMTSTSTNGERTKTTSRTAFLRAIPPGLGPCTTAFALGLTMMSCGPSIGSHGAATDEQPSMGAVAVPPQALGASNAAFTEPVASVTSDWCEMPGMNVDDRDLDLYFVGLNHHRANCESGTAESDLQNLANYIVQQSPDPSKIVIAATGSNYRNDGGVYVDLNSCPAHRLQHILEDGYHSPLTGVGPLCASGSEFRIVTGGDWAPVGTEHVSLGSGSCSSPDSYLVTQIQSSRTGAALRLFDVRFAAEPDEANPRCSDQRRRQLETVLTRALANIGSQALIIGDYNFMFNFPEAQPLLTNPNVDWLTNNLACGNSTLFAQPDVENLAITRASFFQQTSNVLTLVGAAHAAGERVAVPEICHQVLAFRFRLPSCSEGAYCHGICTTLDTRGNCGACGNICRSNQVCMPQTGCVAEEQTDEGCPAGTKDCGVDCKGDLVCTRRAFCPEFHC